MSPEEICAYELAQAQAAYDCLTGSPDVYEGAGIRRPVAAIVEAARSLRDREWELTVTDEGSRPHDWLLILCSAYFHFSKKERPTDENYETLSYEAIELFSLVKAAMVLAVSDVLEDYVRCPTGEIATLTIDRLSG